MPEKGSAPKAPALASPEILSPSTVPENSSVIGIGLVIATFHETFYVRMYDGATLCCAPTAGGIAACTESECVVLKPA